MIIARLALLLLLALGTGLWGCATAQRYQSFYRHEPPTDAVARSCLAQCEQAQ